MKEQCIIKPKGGWSRLSWYLVEVSFSKSNPIHRALFYTGFLTVDGKPGGYNMLCSSTYEGLYTISDVYYLRSVKMIVQENEIEPGETKLPDDLCKKN